MKILLVEDEYHIRQGIKESIEWNALSAQLVGEASNGEEAWHLFQKVRPDVILLDINIPKLNGLQLARKIRSVNQSALVVFLTGYDEFCYVKEAISLEASDYLLKPVTFRELQQALERAGKKLNSQHEQQSINKELRQTSQDQLFLNLLQHREPLEDSVRKLNQIGIRFSERKYTVVCVEFDGGKEASDPPFYCCSCRQLIEEMMKPYGGSYTIADGKNRLVIVFPCNTNNRMMIAKKLQTSLSTMMQLSVTIGVAETTGSWDRLPKAYEESRLAAEYKSYVSDGQLLPFHAIQPMLEPDRHIFEKELDLLSKLKSGMGLQDTFHNWLNEFKLYRLQEAKMIASQLTISLMRIIHEEMIVDENLKTIAPFVQIDECGTMVELISFLSQYFETVSLCIQHKKERSSNKLVEEAKRRIQNHLSEEVSLTLIAEHFHISPNYLSQLFKQSTGETFIDFSTRVRFERAKELLENPKLRIADIANKVGYSDSNYFSIAFRKFYGMTPREYRKRL